MDKYARLMQKLEIVNIEFFKVNCNLYALYFMLLVLDLCRKVLLYLPFLLIQYVIAGDVPVVWDFLSFYI